MYLLSLWLLTPLVQCILIIFINRPRWDAYLHMCMLILVENLCRDSFFTTCGNQFSCYSIRRIFGTLPLSPQQFLLRLYIVGHLFFEPGNFFIFCVWDQFVFKEILILPIYSPYLSCFLPQRRFLFCYTEGVAKI